MNYQERKYRLIVQVEARDQSIIRGEGLIPHLEELDIEDLEQVVSVGLNKFLIIANHHLTKYDGKVLQTRTGFTLRCKHPGPPSVTITAFGMNVDYPNTALTD